MEYFLLQVRWTSELEKLQQKLLKKVEVLPESLPEKEEVLPEIFEKEIVVVVIETQQEIHADYKEAIKDSESEIEGTTSEPVEKIPEPPKPLSQEVKKGDFREVPIIPTPKASNQVETVPI